MPPRTIAPQTTLRQTTLPRAALPRTALLATAGRLAGVDGAAVEQLANRLLDREAAITVASPDRSALNNNGDPLQVCISVAPDRSGVRLIADPATDEADPAARRQRSRSAMERLLIDAALPVAPFRRMLEMVQPDEAADSWDPAVGESWLAAPVTGTGLAVYGNGAWGPPEVVWPRVLRWLRTGLAAGAGAGAGVERVERAARAGYVTPAAVGLETDRRGSRRVKVYVRLAARVPLRLLDLPPLQRPEVAEFLRTVLTGAPLPGTGLVLAIGLGPDGGDVQEVKVDVCACDRCLPALAGPWTVTLGRLSERLGCPFGWDSALVAGVRPAFVGMGLGTVGAPRVNLYLQAA